MVARSQCKNVVPPLVRWVEAKEPFKTTNQPTNQSTNQPTNQKWNQQKNKPTKHESTMDIHFGKYFEWILTDGLVIQHDFSIAWTKRVLS